MRAVVSKQLVCMCVSIMSDLRHGILQYLHTSCSELLRHIEADTANGAEGVTDFLQYRSDYISSLANQASLVVDLPSSLLDLLGSICHDARRAASDSAEGKTEMCGRNYECKVGKPSYNIPEETLTYYLSNHFTIPDIAGFLHVSESTVKRRMKVYGLSVSDTYSNVHDAELDQVVSDILVEFPNTGYRRMIGFLRQKGMRIPEQEVMSSMRRVDPEGVVERLLGLKVLHRRVYHVAGPLRLWHMDGHHKLIR